ncbi:hypothetical protein Dsin_004766 [Dipteronia sinensis]|uniref:C2H2-type domain-containing protein n=1 Tax=Dipteronia sinensis TaxID=43782 RepID=A0AAE0EE98_9ROSI|nr:hypothetical protein Dsin_004766 [Dipteronia sinensis]
MEKHKCKLCPRTFSNGRALGGHMKAHLAALPLPPKTTTQQQQQQIVGFDSTESASSTSSSSGEEQEHGDKSKEQLIAEAAAEDKANLVYGLRNNPKKSFRFADPEFSFAIDSGSVVQDRESETESKNPTRRRSKRSRKLFVAHQDHHQKQNLEEITINQPKLKKPSCVDSPPTEPEPVSSVSDTSAEEDLAMCLMMLSRDAWMRNRDKDEEEAEDHQVKGIKEKKKSVEMLDESEEIKLNNIKIRGKNHHRCEKCRKVFRSYRALNGHKKVCEAAQTRNAGKKLVVAAVDEKIFECPFCFKVFGSGQALGGHKRSHLLASSSSTPASANPIKFDNSMIDLNLPAPLEEDDFSVVSDA